MRRNGSLLFALLTTLAAPGLLGAGPATPSKPSSMAESAPKPKPVQPPPRPESIDEAIRRGVAFLLKDQNKDGSWGSPTRTKDLNIYAPVPGAHHAFETATTALCLCALMEAGGDRTDVRQAIERGEAWMFKHLPILRRATPDALYNVWGHGYAIQALVRMHRRLPQDKERRRKIEDLIRSQMDYLTRYESVDGGWGYYDFRVGSKHPATDS
jgi:hypothetical protein